ncbi:hypothetical protein EYF80_010699 [Liparis tanakae]|uniref:Uncharacterized protein n=1 Tax=Liparis tanakae TaxID=230148 RepID=A0A4Z2ILU1_9TELE|nr:hypothetical protein EYF80_010699 [Liparis tanakae]
MGRRGPALMLPDREAGEPPERGKKKYPYCVASWFLLVPAGFCWFLLVSAASCWFLLVPAAHCAYASESWCHRAGLFEWAAPQEMWKGPWQAG